MGDPVTVGGLAASALGMAADAALKGAIGEAAKDAYRVLKAKVAEWAGNDVQSLEATPASNARRAVVAEIINERPLSDREIVYEFTTTLIAALRKFQDNCPMGIEIEHLEAERVELESIAVTEGIGARIKKVEAKSDFKIGSIIVGGSSGKNPG